MAKYYREARNYGIKKERWKEYAYNKLHYDFEKCLRGLEAKLNTITSSRGDTAFVTFSFGCIDNDREDYNMMQADICKYLLQTRINGHGKGKAPAVFPKLVYLYASKNHIKDYQKEVFELALKCSSRCMYPDFLSLDAGEVGEIYQRTGKAVSPMGSVDKDEVITYRYDGKVIVESFGRLWNRMSGKYPEQKQNTGVNDDVFIKPDNVEVYDSTNSKFVPVRFITKNVNKKWVNVKLSGGRYLTCTDDHPLVVVDGDGTKRVFAKDLVPEKDVVKVVNGFDYQGEEQSMSTDKAWLLGIILCDSSYQTTIVLSIALEGEDDIEEKYCQTMKSEYGVDTRTVVRMRSKKGNYKDIKTSGTIQDVRKSFIDMFGGVRKIDRKIPEVIFRSNRQIRFAFLAGMIDADGYVNNNGNNVCSIVQLGAINKELSIQQMMLANSLGLNARMYSNHYSKDKTKVRYRVEFDATNELMEYIVCQKKLDKFKADCRVRINESGGVVKSVEYIEHDNESYDLTTATDKFDVSGICSHNCRAFLSDYKDENGESYFTGRANIGAVSLNLPMIWKKSDGKDFWKDLDYYLEMIREFHKKRYEYIADMPASTNPLCFCEGGIHGGNKKPWEKIGIDLLRQFTASFGITALNELNVLMEGKPLHLSDRRKVNEVVDYILAKINQFKKDDGFSYALYGTPAESLCFSGDTVVQTYNNNKQIKDIKVGDLVYSYNENANKIELKPVVRSMLTNASAKVCKVKFTNGQEIVCTPNHPFACRKIIHNDGGNYVKEVIEYVEAKNLKPNQRIKSNYVKVENGRKVFTTHQNHIVESVEYLDTEIPVYDIEVEDNHNFYVGGDDGILVHNCGTQLKQFRKMFGVIEGVSDHEYFTNSFHCHVSADITPFEKQDNEYELFHKCNGGHIQYVKMNNPDNIDALREVILRGMKMGFYQGINFSDITCMDCGWHASKPVEECLVCKSKNLLRIERCCGYLSIHSYRGDTRLNDAKLCEIADRISM